MSYDLFISYSRRDNDQGRITQLVERIKTNFAAFEGNNGRELVPFFDQQEIHGMSDWRQRILQGLRESRLLLACLSPAYLKSEYCEWEFVEYLKYEIGHLHGFNGVAPIYFVEVPGWDSKDFEQQCAAWIAELRKRQHFDLRPWHDLGEAALRETAVQERMGKLNGQIVQTITRGERAEKSLGNVDAHNPHFIGRTANLRMLRENFVKPGHIGVVTAVNGVGGLGKTALAIEYAHAFADEYGGGRWQVRCAGKDDLRLALAELATPIGFEFTDDEKKNADLQFERTRRELKKLADARAPHRCLLLLDNVDRPCLLDPAQVARLNGGDWLHILATTRLGENELHGAHRDRSFLAIDELPPDDALALIESYQPDGRFHNEAERVSAREIVRLLGSFTLAVESAAVYLGQFANDVTCAAFLTRLKKEGLEGLDTAAGQSSEGVLHGEKRLSATLQPTLERLGAAEKLTLEFAALLPPDQVPLLWLRVLVARTFPEMERDADPGYPDPWKNVLRRLFSLRLLQITDTVVAQGEPLVVRVHRVIQTLVRQHSLPDEIKIKNSAIYTVLRLRQVQYTMDQFSNLNEIRWEIEAFDAVGHNWADSEKPSAAWAFSEAGALWSRLAELTKAEISYRMALELDEQVRGTKHPKVAMRLSNLGGLLEGQERYEEAEPLLRRALAIREEALAAKQFIIHVGQLADSMAHLADLSINLKRFDEAEQLLRRALELCDQDFRIVVLDANRPLSHIVTSLGRLSSTNRSIPVEELIQTTLQKVESELGNTTENPLPNHIRKALAQVLMDRDKPLDAEFLLKKTLALEERAYGSDHHQVADTLILLGQAMLATDQPVQAESLFRRALKINEANWGSNHPKVADCLSRLAFVSEAGGRLLEAEELRKHSLEILLNLSRSANRAHPALKAARSNYQNILIRIGRTPQKIKSVLHEIAPDFAFPEVQESGHINELALRLYHAGKFAEAESLLRKVLAKSGQSGAANADEIPTTLDVLGQCLKHLKHYAEAEAVMRHSLEIRSKSIPQDTSQTAVSLNNLGQLLYCVKRYSEAQPLMLNALDILEKDHTDNRQLLIAVLNNLAQLQKDAGRLADAEQLFRRAVTIIPDDQAIGSDSLLPVENLARLLKDTGRLAEAEQCLRDLVARCENNFGTESQNVSGAIKNLILFLKETKHLEEAVSLFPRLLAIDEKNLGHRHLDIAADLKQYTNILLNLNRLDEVEPLLKKTIAIAEVNFGSEAPELASELSSLGGLLCALKRQSEAEPFFKREMLIYLKLSRKTGIPRQELKECFRNYFGLLSAMGCSLDQILSAFCDIAPEYFAIDSEQYKALEGIFGRDYFQVIQNWTLRHWNQSGYELRKGGQAEMAEPVDRRVAETTARLLDDVHPTTIHRRNNLVLTLILLGKLEEARQILAANWRLNAPHHANTTPRIAFLRHLIALLESQPDTPFLGQLKNLLTGPELHVASDVAVPWDIAYFIEFLKPKLGEHNASFLTALVAALNDRTKLSSLDSFPEWCNQPPLPLDTPWQEK